MTTDNKDSNNNDRHKINLDVGFKYTAPKPVVRLITRKTTIKEKYLDWFFNKLAGAPDTLCRLAAADFVDVVVAEDHIQEKLYELMKLTKEERDGLIMGIATRISKDAELFFKYLISDREQETIIPNPAWVPKGVDPVEFWETANEEFFIRLSQLYGNIEIENVNVLKPGDKGSGSGQIPG